MFLSNLRAAKLEGYEMALEIIAKEGYDFAHEYFTKANPVGSTKVPAPSWFGFFDALVEHKNHNYRDGRLVRSY